ncbi:MAG: metallophosphoesterase [Alphaproteobacteria bacterium]|nr:metallophosphoesterase [Alphaproteobacteria bacterium]
MPIFLIMTFIIAVSCLLVTYRTLASYSGFPLWAKLGILFWLTISWFSPVILRLIRNYNLLNGTTYAIIAKTAYFMLGIVFVLIMLLLVREIVWYVVYAISKNEALSPDNVSLLNRNNLITVILSVIIAFYSAYEANKTPNVIDFTIEDCKIKQDTKVVVASDLHIDMATPLWQIKQIVNLINAQNPDYILLVGDIIDDEPEGLDEKLDELKKLKAKKIYLSFGNHEHYNAPAKWMLKFTNLGFDVLYNTGEQINDTGLFVAGIPDMYSAEPNFEKASYYATEDNFKILMSHSPAIIKQLNEHQFDLTVSGHTHGGQIYPFHYIVKSANGFLAGMYQVNNNRLYITRGAGYWGPPMRIFAPSDITVFNFKRKENEK